MISLHFITCLPTLRNPVHWSQFAAANHPHGVYIVPSLSPGQGWYRSAKAQNSTKVLFVATTAASRDTLFPSLGSRTCSKLTCELCRAHKKIALQTHYMRHRTQANVRDTLLRRRRRRSEQRCQCPLQRQLVAALFVQLRAARRRAAASASVCACVLRWVLRKPVRSSSSAAPRAPLQQP